MATSPDMVNSIYNPWLISGQKRVIRFRGWWSYDGECLMVGCWWGKRAGRAGWRRWKGSFKWGWASWGTDDGAEDESDSRKRESLHFWVLGVLEKALVGSGWASWGSDDGADDESDSRLRESPPPWVLGVLQKALVGWKGGWGSVGSGGGVVRSGWASWGSEDGADDESDSRLRESPPPWMLGVLAKSLVGWKGGWGCSGGGGRVFRWGWASGGSDDVADDENDSRERESPHLRVLGVLEKALVGVGLLGQRRRRRGRKRFAVARIVLDIRARACIGGVAGVDGRVGKRWKRWGVVRSGWASWGSDDGAEDESDSRLRESRRCGRRWAGGAAVEAVEGSVGGVGLLGQRRWRRGGNRFAQARIAPSLGAGGPKEGVGGVEGRVGKRWRRWRGLLGGDMRAKGLEGGFDGIYGQAGLRGRWWEVVLGGRYLTPFVGIQFHGERSANGCHRCWHLGTTDEGWNGRDEGCDGRDEGWNGRDEGWNGRPRVGGIPESMASSCTICYHFLSHRRDEIRVPRLQVTAIDHFNFASATTCIAPQDDEIQDRRSRWRFERAHRVDQVSYKEQYGERNPYFSYALYSTALRPAVRTPLSAPGLTTGSTAALSSPLCFALRPRAEVLLPSPRSHYCTPGLTIGSTAVHGGPPLLSSLHYLPGLTIGSTAAGIRVMASRTRSGRVFSRTDFVPYQHQLVQLPVFELSEAHTADEDFAMLLFDAAQRRELEDEACGDDAEGAELTNGPSVEGSAHTPRPSTSSAPSRLHLPLSREEQRKDAKRARRSSARVAAAKLRTPYTRVTAASRPAAAASAPPMPDDTPIRLFDINAQSFRRSKGGAWTGTRTASDSSEISLAPDVEELLSHGFGYVPWKGRIPKCIYDSQDRGFVTLAGRPSDPGWDKVIRNAVASMEWARDEGLQKQSISADSVHHRRGDFVALATGTSHGGGQKQPGNLKHTPSQGHLIQRLLGDRNIQRIAGFQSSAFAAFSPKLYDHYATVLRDLYDNDPSLQHNFHNSVFPACTFNCGPHTSTRRHTDFGNWPSGQCVITSMGRYDSTKGGHLVLYSLKLIVEFPPGSTILLPSGTVEHGNIPVRSWERRLSFTQYAAGGLFRWVAYNFQTAKSLLEKEGGGKIRADIDGKKDERWLAGIDLFSKRALVKLHDLLLVERQQPRGNSSKIIDQLVGLLPGVSKQRRGGVVEK
ncbi:hypothetical protein FPV67DRAFT_1657312 [Lyophyllum atratum]|nr:hypothetical protein FPV67DRAFT_1657312 [Lyophyllum atratum]